MRRPLTIIGVLITLVGVMLAPVGAGATGHLTSSVFSAQLSGAHEVPPVDTDASGFATITISEDETSIDYRLYANDIEAVTQAHIHVGSEGENGPVAVFLFGPADPAVDNDGLLAEGTITEEDLIATEGVFDGTMAQFLILIRAGQTYVNVHTEANPMGEIRGQLFLAPFNFGAWLSGANEVPPVETDASGFAAFTVNTSETAVSYRLLTFGLEDATQAHIHIGPAGENGPVAVFLFGLEPMGVTQNGLLAQGTFTEADLIATGGVFDGTMATLLDHMRAGTAYVNVHTIANPMGEIRGQTEGLNRLLGDGAFIDDNGTTHEGNIDVIAAADITRGCNPPVNDEYCGDLSLTRGQAAAFFNRALNLPPATTDHFVDDDTSVFEADINAAAEVGITLGCNPPANDEFCPDDTVTRAQWASFVVRALGLTEGAGDDLFTDDNGSVHEEDIDRIGTAGITLGCNPPANDQYCPSDPVTRSQAASFLARVMGWVAIDS